MIKRIIFDIDYTLLVPNYYREKEFFSRILSSENAFFINNMYLILKKLIIAIIKDTLLQ